MKACAMNAIIDTWQNKTSKMLNQIKYWLLTWLIVISKMTCVKFIFSSLNT